MSERKATRDRGSEEPAGGFHTASRIGARRHLTPEGFLVCEAVPIARTGWMVYAPGEVPLHPGPDGYVMVERDAGTLFDPVCLLSFIGKPITNDHPVNGVSPSNWSSVAVGSVHNVRRGEGADYDVMLADLLVTQDRAIRDVQSGKVEVSAGYDATYEQTGVGQGRQLQIIGNHIALVERGRCGPRCAIGDRLHNHEPKGNAMPTLKKRVAVSDAVKEMIANLTLLDEQADDDGDAVHVHVHTGDSGKPGRDPDDDPIEARFRGLDERMTAMSDSMAAVADAVSKLVPPAPAARTGDDGESEVDDAEGRGRTGDSSALATGFRAVMADAEVLVPGISAPSFDAAAPRAKTVDSMCQLRRRALDAFYLTGDGKVTIDSIRSGALDTSAMTCADVAVAFRQAAGTKRLLNNRAATGDSRQTPAAAKPALRPPTIAEVNAANRKFYADRA